MKYFSITLITIATLCLAGPAWSASTKQEIIELKAQVADMQKELAEIKQLLKDGARAPAAGAQPPAFNAQTVSIGPSPVKGQADAPVTIIEYSDYQCPFCARNYRDVMPLIQQEYIDTGKVKFVMRENPLVSMHKNAMNASMAALCAGDQGKYWEMHNILFENQRELGSDNLKKFAGTIGLNTSKFNKCLDDNAHEKSIQADMASGAKLGISGTPGFVIGKTDLSDTDKVDLSAFIKGAQPIDNFRATIEDLLKGGE